MPQYELQCPECRLNMDALLTFDIYKNGTVICPDCNKEFKCYENSKFPALAPPVFSGIFTDLEKVQKNNERLKRKTSKG